MILEKCCEFWPWKLFNLLCLLLQWEGQQPHQTRRQEARNTFNILYDNRSHCSRLSELRLAWFSISWLTTIKLLSFSLKICAGLQQQCKERCKNQENTGNMSLHAKNWRHLANWVASVNYSSVKGERCLHLMSPFRLRVALPKGAEGRVPLSITKVPGRREHSWDSASQSFTLHSTQLRTGTHRRSVLCQRSWSCLLFPCCCRGSCVRRLLCLFLPSVSLSLQAGQFPEG